MKIIIIPHTHWDREWYFTSEVSQSLLMFNIDNALNNDYNIEKFYLDGQVSLVENYLNYASSDNKEKISSLIKYKKIITGPLYSQPDVFNSLGETTLRNIEIAAKVLKDNNLPSSNIFYCPDTFGFGFNLPQLLTKKGFDKFVFWRGLPHEYENDDYIIWKQNDKYGIKCYRYKYGYWLLGPIFPWRDINWNNLDEKAKEFLNSFKTSKIYDHFRETSKKTNNTIIIPFGGDQAPIIPYTSKFFKLVNKYDCDNEWEIGDFESYFKLQSKIIPKSFSNTIDYGYESKIHRTITSTRYDFKKLFRDNEVNLYHQLEPLQVFYKNCDKKYHSNNDNIIKEITMLQAHDILGGCVSDNTYASCYQKLKNIHENIESKKTLLMKQISTELNLNEKNLLIFNPNNSKHVNSLSIIKVYTNKIINGYYEDDECFVASINSHKFDDIKYSYENKILVINKNINPLNLKIINFDDLKRMNIIFNKNENTSRYLNFKIFNDNGDLFDADPSNEIKYNLNIKESKSWSFNNLKITKVKFYLIVNKIKTLCFLTIYKFKEKEYINFNFKNKFKNVIVKWNPNLQFSKCYFKQHLGVDQYFPRIIKNKKTLKKYKEYPMNIEKNSGIIFDKKHFITTKGNNEFFYDGNSIWITLYRSVGIVGKPNLKIRPGVASGLENHKIHTPLGQLNKEINFEFEIGKTGNINKDLNSHFKKPILYHPNSLNVIYSKMERFIITKKDLKIIPFNIKIPENVFVSCLKIESNNSLLLRYVDFDPENDDFNDLKEKEIFYE